MDKSERDRLYQRILDKLGEVQSVAFGVTDGTFEEIYDIVERAKREVLSEYRRGRLHVGRPASPQAAGEEEGK